MKKIALYLMTVLVVCLSFIFAACKPTTEVKDEIMLNETAITLEIGESQTLTATTNVTSGVQWSISDDTIATVEDGVVTALAAGTATVTATAGTAQATCTVTVNEEVKDTDYAELTVDKTEVELREGGASVSVTATFTVNDEEFDCDLVWISADESIATVEDGSILPVSVGSTVVTVSAEYNGETYSVDISVEVKPDEHIQVSKGVMELALIEINGDIISDTFTATAYKSGEENTEVELEFVSSDESVAIVNVVDGVATVTSVGEGSCTISVSYESAYGKIETLVSVTVTRSTIVLDETFEIMYVEGNTVFDISSLELQGELEGIYAEDEKVGSEDGLLEDTFVEKSKGVIVPVEVRTSVAIYEAQLLIAVPYKAEPKQEVGERVLVDLPTYDGDATTLGFPEGTETAYELVVDAANGLDGWNSRMILNAATDKDVVVFDVIVTDIASLDFRFTMWPAKNTFETQGSYGVSAKANDPSVDADFNRKIFVLGTDGRQPDGYATGTLYTVYFFLNRGETHVHFSTFTDGVLHIANIRCIDADEVENDPTLPPPPISQGEDHNPMPTFDGDVTTLGFEAGTVVYVVDGPQSNATDVKLVAQVDASGDNAYAKFDIVLSEATNSFGMWITAKASHLGYYTVTPTGATADGLGDPSRAIFVTDANGERVTSFAANTMYTLYVGLDGREATIQLTTWANLTMYIANFACITASEAPVEPVPPVVDGKSISILFIGNSFSDDTEAYMVDILLNLGYTNIDIGNLYIGGCSIDTHYENILSGVPAYDFRMRSHNGTKFTEYETVTVGGSKQSLDFAIPYKAWDIISVQQASGYSGQANSYNNLDALVEQVRSKATNPDVEFVFNMTWAYQANSTHAQFPDYNSDQMTMYNAILSAVQEKVNYTVVPNATAIQNARTSFIGDNLTRDGYHLNLKIGRFIAGLTFVAKVTGADLTDFDYIPNGVTKSEFAVAIESVTNAIANPFVLTESSITVDPSLLPEAEIMAGGSNTDAVTLYTGDVTALGFAEGTTVYQYVGVDSSSDKVAIKVDSVNYDYVDVQFIIASGDGYFFMHGLKNGNWHNSGASYVVDPGWIRLGDGNNTPSDRVIEIYDANGNSVNALMSNNVLYTLRVYTKVGELDEIRISKNGTTMYLANVTYGVAEEQPVEGPIKQGDGQIAMATYAGDVTALGFEEGTFLQYMVTETLTGGWWEQTSVDSNGKTREQLSARIPGEAGKYVTIKFAVSEDIASGSVFYVWGLLGKSYTQNGGVNFTTTEYGRIMDLDGHVVTSISKNTVYILELYIADTDTYKVANICTAGMEMYFAADSLTYSNTSFEAQAPTPDEPDTPVDPEPDEPDIPVDPDPDQSDEPDTQAPIVSGETTSTALTVYEGDVTALGFASGTTVYQLASGESSWNDRVKIAVDSANYDFVDVEFIVVSGSWYFNLWAVNANGMLDGVYLVTENTANATYGAGYAVHAPNQGGNGGATKIQVLDVDGNVVVGGRTLGTKYVLRVFLGEESLTEIQIGQADTTILFANVAQGLIADLPVEGPIKQGESLSSLPNYTGDVTAHGFEAGEFVQYMVTETMSNAWGTEPTSGKTREQLAARIPGEVGKYVTVKFAVSQDIASGSVFYVWGLMNSTHTQNDGVNFTTTNVGRILDVDGYPVGSLSKNTVYVLELYIPDTNWYKVSNICSTGMELYFAADSITYSDSSMAVKLPGSDSLISAGGTNAGAVTFYTGDVTALGFAAGTEVFQYVGVDSVTDKAAIKVDSVNYDYVDVQFIIASGDGYFFLHGLKNGNWHNSGASYVVDPGWIRLGDGNNTPSDRVIEIYDANGNSVNALMSNNVLYTLRVYTKVGELDEIRISKNGTTMYLANVTYGIVEDTPVDPEPDEPDTPVDPEPDEPDTQAPIVSGESNSTALTVYDGNVTELGFANGTTVYQLVAGDSSWNDRVKIAANPNYKYLDVQFIVASGNWYFTVWVVSANGMLDGTYNVAELAGGTQHATFGDGYAQHMPYQGGAGGRTRIQVLDADGNVVIGNRPNGTIYTLRVWLEEENVTEIQIGQSNVTMYFANIESTDKEPEMPIKQGDNRTTLEYYTGDVTALGFAAGTKVQQLVGKVASGWGEEIYSERAVIVANGAQDYISVDFMLANDFTGSSLFHIWPSTGAGSFKMDGTNAVTTAVVTVVDQKGMAVTAIEKGKIYTLRVYDPGAKHVALGAYGLNTIYFANVVYGQGEPAAPIVPSVTAAGTNKNAVTIYDGDETALGFAAGSVVYKYVGETSADKLGIKVDSSKYDYVDIQMVFDAASTKTWFLGFVMNGSAYLNGADAYILSGNSIRFNANANNPLDRSIVFLKDGQIVNTALETGVVYTLRIHIKPNNVTEIQMRQVGVTAYLANVTHGWDDVAVDPDVPEEPDEPDVPGTDSEPTTLLVDIKVGDNKDAATMFDGEETMYGFAAGTDVVVMALESTTDVDDKRLVMEVDSSMNYFTIDFALEFGLLGNIYVWTVTDGGERVLVATILADGGVAASVDVAIKDSDGNDVTNEMLASLESGEAEKYTLYVYCNGVDEVHIGCDDYDDDFGGNILYFADAKCER